MKIIIGMVFGWGKKKQEKKEPPEPTTETINLDQVPAVVDNLTDLREKQLISEVSILIKRSNPQIKELSKIAKQLEKDDLKVDDIDKHLRIIVARGKKQVIQIMKKEIAEISSVSTYNDVLKAESELGQMLKKVGDALGRHTRVIHIFAKKYAEKLKDTLEDIDKNHKEIESLIKNYNNTKDYANSIRDNYDKLRAYENSISKNLSKKQEIKSEMDSFDSQINEVNSKIEKIKSSTEYKEYLSLIEKLSKHKEEKSKIKNEIDLQFTKISRPLNRYEYVAALDKDQKEILQKLTKEPADVINSANKNSIIVILENIRKEITTGSISVKDTEKTMSSLTEIIESLDKFISKISDYYKTHNELEKQIEEIRPRNLSELEESLDHLVSKRKDLETRLTHIEDEIDSATTSIPELKKQIERDLQKFSSTKYSIAN